MDKTIKTSRIVLLVLILAAVSAVVLVSMYRVQIIEGEKSLAASKNSIVTESVAAAARGNIFDRYGRPLATNRTCSNLVINSQELFEQEDPNAIILQLAREVVDSGNKYTDTLPITKVPPFEYVKNMTEIQQTMLKGYIDENELPATTTAVELMAFFRDAFKIDSNYSAEEMRIISGIRFEIKIRHIINTASYIFAEDVGIGLLTKLMENNVPGFDERPSFIREVKTDYAAHVLGYVGMMNEEETKEYRNDGYSLDALVGKDGMEKAFESRLHGTDGLKRVATTREGTIIETNYIVDPIPGDHVYTTIDLGLQEKAELAMSAFINETNATREVNNEKFLALGQTKDVLEPITGGGIAVIQVKTGEPLAIASYPTYNLSTLMEDYNELTEDKNSPLFNRALVGAYAPGSTFKPCVALAILDKDVASLQYTVYDEGKYMKHADQGYSPECWIYPNGSHGDVNATKAIAVSCNYYFYTLGEQLGIDLMSDYANRFGLGLHTGIELSESVGVMSTQEYKEKEFNEKWVIGDTIQSAIGQSFTVFTPLQMANYAAALANNGTRYEASLLKSVRSYDYSKSIFQRTPKVSGEVKMNQEYYDAVKLGMYRAVTEEFGGTRTAFAGFPVNVAAKTGTAQLGEGRTNNAMFICFAPYEDPEIAVAIAIEHGGSGSSVATIARDVLSYYFNFKNASMAMETENSLLK